MTNVTAPEKNNPYTVFQDTRKVTNPHEKMTAQTTEIKTRWVNNPDRGEEAQIELQIIQIYPNQVKKAYASMQLTHDQAIDFARSILPPHLYITK